MENATSAKFDRKGKEQSEQEGRKGETDTIKLREGKTVSESENLYFWPLYLSFARIVIFVHVFGHILCQSLRPRPKRGRGQSQTISPGRPLRFQIALLVPGSRPREKDQCSLLKCSQQLNRTRELIMEARRYSSCYIARSR